MAAQVGKDLERGEILFRALPQDGEMTGASIRHLVLVLGDQLNFDNPALDGFDPAQDRILMAECPGEAAQVWSHKARIALFLSAMRHHAQALAQRGWPLER